MQLEILGGRVLAPYFGYSVYQWGALIGVVMTALAIGYWLGGRVGDRTGAAGFLFWAFAVSAAFVVVVPPFADAFMPATRVLGPAWGAVAATALLLGVPSVLLATTSPIIIRLTATEMIARDAGRVYAVSTVGSIAGTFFTAFYIIPELGSRLGHFVVAGLIAMALVALALTGRRPLRLTIPALLIAGVAALGGPPARPGVLYRAETLHNIITVMDVGPTRLLFLNYTRGAQTVMVKGRLLTGSYYDYFLLGPRIAGGDKVLFLGTAGGTALKQLVRVYPKLRVTGVDLDPQVIAVARKYFGLANEPRVTLVAADARWFLSRSRARYDMIAIDLYVTGHIPFFAATREFFAMVRDRLTERGVLMVNILSLERSGELVGPLVRTVRTAFPSTFLIDSGNYILLASKQAISLRALRDRLAEPVGNPVLQAVAARALNTLRASTPGPKWPIFTDDRNDVEFRTFRANERIM